MHEQIINQNPPNQKPPDRTLFSNSGQAFLQKSSLSPPQNNRLSHAQRYGLAGEYWALKQLQERNYNANLVSSFFANIDILINGLLAVEVKIAHKTYRRVRPGYYRPCWQFDISRCLPAKQDWILIAIAEDQAGQLWPYVLKSAWLAGRATRLTLTSHPNRYRGWMARHLNRWSNIETLLQFKQKKAGQLMLPLFSEVGRVAA